MAKKKSIKNSKKDDDLLADVFDEFDKNMQESANEEIISEADAQLSLKEFIDKETSGGKLIIRQILKAIKNPLNANNQTLLAKAVDMYKGAISQSTENPVDKMSVEDIRKEIIQLDDEIAELKKSICLNPDTTEES